MSKDVDENLIEATIRRIQAQNADDTPTVEPDDEDAEDAIQATIRRVQAQSDASAPPTSEVEDTPEGEYASASMDRIRDTIRRVQSQAAAHALPDEDPIAAPPVEDDPIEATIRRVQAQAAANTEATEAIAASGLTTFDLDSSERAAPEDEDPIETTIRRVQAQAAAQAESTPSVAEEAEPSEDEDPIAATIRRVAAAKAARANQEWDDEDAAAISQPRSVDHVDAGIRIAETNPKKEELPLSAAASIDSSAAGSETRPEPTPWPGRDERMLGEAATWEVAAQRLEQGLQDAQREVRALSARLDALLSSAPAFSVVAPTKQKPDAEEWDDSPQVSRMQFAAPPRQQIMRDPSPQTATAAELVPEPIREFEKPAAAAPRLRAIDAEGNLGDHLPRQYRITVEDKRRGVDLVPLHRAMQSLSNLKDMSLLSYSNGVAIVLVESVGAIDPELLRLAVARAMSRETKIEVHNEQTMVVKIQED